jgi:hypothetical protein
MFPLSKSNLYIYGEKTDAPNARTSSRKDRARRGASCQVDDDVVDGMRRRIGEGTGVAAKTSAVLLLLLLLVCDRVTVCRWHVSHRPFLVIAMVPKSASRLLSLAAWQLSTTDLALPPILQSKRKNQRVMYRLVAQARFMGNFKKRSRQIWKPSLVEDDDTQMAEPVASDLAIYSYLLAGWVL